MDNKEKDKLNNAKDESFDLTSLGSKNASRRFKKKKRGISLFFSKVGEQLAKWWNSLKKWQKITITTLSSIIAVLIAAIIFLTSFFGYNYNSITKDPNDLGFENVINKKIVNIALFGLDTRNVNVFKGNSDSIMVLSINTETKTVKIVSIMRDSLVPIEKDGRTYYRKINSAYATGGPELAIKTINRNFGLDISEYATVNFFGMVDIIDAVGGIDAELTSGEVISASASSYALNGCIKNICKSLKVDPEPYYITQSGKHHLNGIQAVAYSRIRKFRNIWGTTDDFGRTDRQRYVMEQLFNKALTLDKSQYVKLAKSLIPCSETSLSYSEIMSLAVNVLLKSPKFEQSRMPLNEYQMKAPNIPSVGSCVYYDLEFAKNLLHAFFYDNITPEQYVETNGIQKNDWYSQTVGISRPSANSSDNTSKKPTVSSSNSTSSDKVSKPQTNSSIVSSNDKDTDSSGSSSVDSSSEESPSSTDSSSDNSSENTTTESAVSSDENTSSEQVNTEESSNVDSSESQQSVSSSSSESTDASSNESSSEESVAQ